MYAGGFGSSGTFGGLSCGHGLRSGRGEWRRFMFGSMAMGVGEDYGRSARPGGSVAKT